MPSQLLYRQSRWLHSAGNTRPGGASAYDTRIIKAKAKYGGKLLPLSVEPSKAWVWDWEPPVFVVSYFPP